jgi:hypothetical protein
MGNHSLHSQNELGNPMTTGRLAMNGLVCVLCIRITRSIIHWSALFDIVHLYVGYSEEKYKEANES